MCGIAGYIGYNAEQRVYDMLKKLEYRGYDSAGIASITENRINLVKTEGKVENLHNKLLNTDSYISIGHTRWATHGNATITNSHPHISQNKAWAVVHNGIIENYKVLKNNLLEKGYDFISDTDTEVIPMLLEQNQDLDLNLCLQATLNSLCGSFALAIINKNLPNTMILAKKQTPLYLAKKDNNILVASDPIAFSNVDNYYIFDDNEYCLVSPNSLIFYNFKGEKILKKPVANICKYQEKNNIYTHHMLEEIYYSPNALKILSNMFRTKEYQSKICKINSLNFDKIFIIGCGTAYHSALMGSKYIEKSLKIPCQACIASEFVCEHNNMDKKTLCIFVSQSGETLDTITSLLYCKKKKIKTIAVVNYEHSTLSRLSDISLPICAGQEIAVASTKAYLNQCATFFLLSKVLCSKNFIKDCNNSTQKLLKLSKAINKVLCSNIKSKIEQLANQIKDAKNVFFIGKNLDYVSACEASLKLKEVSYINCSSLPTGELKHGTLALIEKGTYVISLATNNKLLSKNENAINETTSRGSTSLMITTKKCDICQSIHLASISNELDPLLCIIPMWLLSYYVSISKGINPDKPRNLAKSVTVE